MVVTREGLVGSGRAGATPRPACCAGVLEVEHRGLKRLGLLLDILTAGLACCAKRLTNVGQVAEGDRSFLSYQPLCGWDGRDRFALPGGGECRGHGWQP